MLNRRQARLEGRLDLDPARPIVIDETGASTKMARVCSRAPLDQWRAGHLTRTLENDHLR